MNWLTTANKRWHVVSMTDIMSDLIMGWPDFKMAVPINVLAFSRDIIAREQIL